MGKATIKMSGCGEITVGLLGAKAPTPLTHGSQLTEARFAEIERRILAIEAQPDLYRLLLRYRTETPLGHQPHMIAQEADAVLARARGEA